jgi:hypothetical protein
MSDAPVSVAGVTEQAFPARSVAVADGVQVMEPGLVAVLTIPEVRVPSVTTTVVPDIVIVEPVKVEVV